MQNNLSQLMQARLEKWRNNQQPVKSAEKLRGSSHSSHRQVRGDYGDDIQDYQQAQQKALEEETKNKKDKHE